MSSIDAGLRMGLAAGSSKAEANRTRSTAEAITVVALARFLADSEAILDDSALELFVRLHDEGVCRMLSRGDALFLMERREQPEELVVGEPLFLWRVSLPGDSRDWWASAGGSLDAGGVLDRLARRAASGTRAAFLWSRRTATPPGGRPHSGPFSCPWGLGGRLGA